MFDSFKKLIKRRQKRILGIDAGAASINAGFAKRVKLFMVLVKVSVNISETITITFDSGSGANYDTVLATFTLSAQKNYAYIPTGEVWLEPGDDIVVAITNATTTGVAYVTIIGEDLGKV